MSGVPGLSDIPVLRRIFGNTETSVQQTDIVLTLTPHIIRIPDVTEEDLLPLWIGTEQNIALRGASKQSAFGPSLFESDGGEEGEAPPPPELPVEEAAPRDEGEFQSAAPGGQTAPEAKPPVPEEPAAPAPQTPSETEEPPPPPEPPKEEPKPSSPPSTARVALNPSQVSVEVNQEFSVTATINSPSSVGSVPFHLVFDPAALEFASFSRSSPFLQQDGTPVFVLATVGGGGREVIVGLSRQGGRAGATGEGELITLTFRARQPGTTTLTFSDLSVLDTNAQRLPVQSQGTTVIVQPGG